MVTFAKDLHYRRLVRNMYSNLSRVIYQFKFKQDEVCQIFAHGMRVTRAAHACLIILIDMASLKVLHEVTGALLNNVMRNRL